MLNVWPSPIYIGIFIIIIIIIIIFEGAFKCLHVSQSLWRG
jgi:hypothetical protein